MTTSNLQLNLIQCSNTTVTEACNRDQQPTSDDNWSSRLSLLEKARLQPLTTT